MNRKIEGLLEGRGGNYMLPFFWQHGEDEETLRTYMRVIQEANIGAVCVESRPHPDFCGPLWWRDMDIILDEARKRGMKVWILDDSHFPTGFANGAMKGQPDERCRQSICLRTLSCREGEELTISQEELRHPKPSEPNQIEQMIGSGKQRVFEDDRLLGVYAVRTGADAFLEKSGTMDLQKEAVADADGGLRWKVPEGEWKVYVLHLSRNMGVHRDYINMMDEASCRVLIDAVYEPHYAHYKEDFGTTIAGFFSDEPELGNGHLYAQDTLLGTDVDFPWSVEVEERLAKVLGGDYAALLPLLWENDADPALTARVRYAYMDTVSSLVEKDFSFQIGDWCRAHGVQYIGHLIEDNNMHARTGSSLGHYFRGLGGQDMAGIDDIGGQVLPGQEDVDILGVPFGSRIGEFYHYMLGKLGNSQAALDPLKKGNAMCEIFGAYGWSEGVRLEKYLLDHFLVRGINHFVPHAFSPKDFPDPDCPPHFYAHGHNPQYRHFGKLMAYGNRVCELISDGVHRAPAAVLYHGEAEWSGRCMLSHKVAHPLSDRQIEYDFVPQDVFQDTEKWDFAVEEGGMRVGTQRYRAVFVPYMQFVRSGFAQAVPALCEAGVPVIFVGGYPEGICDLRAEEFGKEKALVDGLRAGRAIPEEALSAVVEELGIQEIRLTPADNRIRYYHYVHEDQTEVYLFVNEGEKPYEGVISFAERADGKTPYLYDAWENKRNRADFGADGLHLVIEPLKSRILILDASVDAAKMAEGIAEECVCGGQEIAFTGDWMRSLVKSIAYPQFGEETKVTLPDALEKELPRFSGFAQYRNRFEGVSGMRAVLEITDAGEAVEVFLNGESLGIQIAAPFSYDLAGCVRDGENVLCIQVATTLEREMADVPGMFGRKPEEPKCASGLCGTVRITA